jgi:Thioredoxin
VTASTSVLVRPARTGVLHPAAGVPGETVAANPSPTHDDPPQAAPGNDARPLLLFFTDRRSGVARRMSSLVAWVSVTEKSRLRVIEVDVDENRRFAKALDVSTVPTLLIVHEREVLGRHEGRATGQDIEDLIRPHVAARHHAH